MMRKAIAIVAGVASFATAVQAEPDSGKVQAGAGRAVYLHWCASCHAPGERHPGTMALGAKYEGKIPAALVDRNDLDPQLVRVFVRQGITVMPSFRKTEISDAELDALVRFLTVKPRTKRK